MKQFKLTKVQANNLSSALDARGVTYLDQGNHELIQDKKHDEIGVEIYRSGTYFYYISNDFLPEFEAELKKVKGIK